MTSFKIGYVKRFKDRHGKIRHYYRRKGYESVCLPGRPGSSEFMNAYRMAEQSHCQKGAGQTRKGTISALMAEYYQSTEWSLLNPSTQANYRNILERFRSDYGELSVAEMLPKHIKTIRDRGADRPGATRNLLKRIRGLFKFAVDRDIIAKNPVAGVALPKEGKGFRPWTDDDIAKFKAKWPLGTRENTALNLLLFTGQRRSDVVRMGFNHLSKDGINVIQKKGGYRVSLSIPIHTQLQLALDTIPKTNTTFIMTEYGKPMSEAGFTQWFVESAKSAGLPPRSSPHGLRKAAARRLAEAGCTSHEIAAITGHTSLREVERYTKSAEQGRLAKAAIAKLTNEK